MRIIYMVYREDNTLVFNSQVLQYLKIMENNGHDVELILFRNHVNYFKKDIVESKISSYIKKYITFPTLPPLTMIQLDVAALRLKKYFSTKFKVDEPLLVICRGELSTYVASKAFRKYNNKIVLFDNRGLPIEELEMRNKKSIIYKLNKSVKEKAIHYSKDNCDIYSFVTNNLRKYLLKKYDYCPEKRYFIFPTLNINQELNISKLNDIKKEINFSSSDFYVIYVGSLAAWQNINTLFKVFEQIKREICNAKLLILTNGKVRIPETLKSDIVNSIIIKSVRHDLVKYYLDLCHLGLVLRDDNIVNKVAAPTKIAEYLSNNMNILYSGEIGVLVDLEKYNSNLLININDKEWLNKVKFGIENDVKENKVKEYFDMEKNQGKLIDEIKKLMSLK